MPVFLHTVDIFIPDIHAARKADLSVNHKNLSVVAVVVMRGKNRANRRKHLALHALRLKLLRIPIRQIKHRTGSVIHHPYLNTCLHLPFQNLQNFLPHIAFLQDEIFHKNELLRPL